MIDTQARLSEVFNMDCMVGMAQYPDKWFDLAVVDPPYGIGKFTCENRTDVNGIRRKNKKTYADDYKWNESTPETDYFSEVRRISKHQIIWGANYYNCFDDGGGCIVWYKGDGTDTVSRCEIASTSTHIRIRFVHINWQAGFYRQIKEGEQIHPCQKPIALYDWIYAEYLPQGGKVIDTHLGSGSNRIAANKAGNIDFTGYEIDKDYYEAQEKRWKGFIAQTRLI